MMELQTITLKRRKTIILYVRKLKTKIFLTQIKLLKSQKLYYPKQTFSELVLELGNYKLKKKK